MFADEDTQAQDVKQVQQQVKQQQDQKKKITVKVAKAPTEVEDAHEFEKVENRDKQQSRGGDRRGGRGGNRGDRGGRGRGGQDRPREPREPREPRAEGEGRGRGERRGRGRGDRPKTAQPVAADGAIETEERKDDAPNRGGRGGRGPRYQGKNREEDHPMDRQDGTGRGRRGDRKGGHGKGNWGKEGEENNKDKDAPTQEEQEKRREERRERKAKQEEEKKEEPVEEEEEEGFTLDDYFAAKQAKSQGNLKKAEGRKHDDFEMKRLKDENYKHDEKYTTKIYKKADTNATRANAGAELLGFQATVDQGDEFNAKRGGGRGGRGGRDNQPRDRQDGGQRRRRGGKIVVDDNEFPTL